MNNPCVSKSGELIPRVQGGADVITNDWRTTIQGIIKTGQDLIRAKAELDHGEWGELTGRAEGSEGLLPFGYRTASRLMEISNNPHILNGTHVSHLPASWGTLYELTKLSDDQWEKGLRGGLIGPDMSREDVYTLMGGAASVLVTKHTGDQESYTPEKYIEAARIVLGGIDLDPAFT